MFNFLLLIIIIIISTSNIACFHIDSTVANIHTPAPTTQSFDKFFASAKFPFSNEFIATNPYNLMRAAQDTLNFLHTPKGRANTSHNPQHFKGILTRERVEATLNFIISTIKQDLPSGKFRILDPAFLNKNFHFIRWKPDNSKAKNCVKQSTLDENIRVTSYAIFNVTGNTKKNADFPCAIYQVLDPTITKQYTKQQILAGILERPENKKRVRALAWLSRNDFEDALMQGTIIVKLSNNKECMFVANESNEIEYDKKEKDSRNQKRFWFFREIKNSQKTIKELKKRLKMRQNVIFAGDIYNIGIGKIIAIKHPNRITNKPELRLGVLADTGGVFIHNLYQIDLFAGIFNNRTELSTYLKNIPCYAQAYILYR